MGVIHIFFLIINLAGQPVGVMESKPTYQTMEVCKSALPDAIMTLQHQIDTDTVDAGVAGNYAVADAICSTEADMAKPASPKPGQISDPNAGKSVTVDGIEIIHI